MIVLNEDEIRESLTEEEMIFVETISLNPIWINHKKNDSENDSTSFLDKLITECEDHLTEVMSEEKISKSSFEFYKEIIKEMKNLKNKDNKEDQNQINLKLDKDNKKININLDDIEFNYENEEEEEAEEIMTEEQVINDIKALRKKPLE
jgi:maltodextrin utilization protein YvdJ